MPTINVLSRAKETSLSAVVTRKDGRVEDLGVVAYGHTNPLRRLWWRITRLVRRKP